MQLIKMIDWLQTLELFIYLYLLPSTSCHIKQSVRTERMSVFLFSFLINEQIVLALAPVKVKVYKSAMAPRWDTWHTSDAPVPCATSVVTVMFIVVKNVLPPGPQLEQSRVGPPQQENRYKNHFEF